MAKDFIDLIPEQYPELRDIPIRDAQIILLASAGIEKTTIAEAMDISRQTVYDILGKYKITDMIRGGVNLQAMLTRAQIGTLMVEAASELMNKKSELKAMNARQLLDVVQKCAGTMTCIKVNTEERKPSQSVNPFEELNKIAADGTKV
jgi:predicted DNA-binding protein YlxM (UPF0122 family)